MMYRGTTPTISYRLPFSAEQLAEAYITIAQNDEVKIEKSLSECETNGDTITAELTQEDTLKLDKRFPAEIQLRIRTLAGDALATEPDVETVGKILKDGVI